MALEEIKEKIDRLMDDNHVCLGIEHAEESSEEDISEARMRRRANLLEMNQLTKVLDQTYGRGAEESRCRF